MKNLLCPLVLGIAVLAGCGDSPPASGGGHRHESLHGGTAVELGAHEFQLDVVHDPATGTLRAYVMDAHLQNFIRIPVESFVVMAALPSGEAALAFHAVANAATGEKAGDTSLFEAQSEALKGVSGFNAVLKELAIRGRSYTNLAFHVGSPVGVGTARP